MKQFTVFFRNLIWITQLGFSVIAPLLLFTLGAVWLQNRFSLGSWCVWLGIVLGILGALGGLYHSLRTMNREDSSEDKPDPPVGFNDHD